MHPYVGNGTKLGDAVFYMYPASRYNCPELAHARIQAHSAFDHLWKAQGMKRTEAYEKLRKDLKLPKWATKFTHIRFFDLATCNRIIEMYGANKFDVVEDTDGL